jgi:pyruvate dehydrogenase E2 component (dihydrolipoamide acetyltransferase)
MADFTMPALGADMETGKLVQWLVRPGARVRRGDVVAVVETHKGAIDVEIFLDGVIEQLAPVGEDLPVGAVLARVRTAGETPAAAPVMGASRARVSPAARRRAGELDLDAAGLPGSGAEGAVTLADVERAAAARQAGAPAPARRGIDPAQMRQAIAAAMARSKREIPHYYLGSSVDMQAASRWLEAYNADRPPDQRLLPAVLLLKATATALRQVPQLNGWYEDGAFRAGPGIHPGWAIALRGGGLVAPAVHDAERKSLAQLMDTLRDLVQRARIGGLRSSEMTDPTITVTSLGERGAESVFGVIYPPQVAIVGFGRMVPRPCAVDGGVQVRPQLALSLAADHRVSDGHLGGQLLAAIDRALQDPETL